MYLFKTSGATFKSVIQNQKHAFKSKPRDWVPGEIVLVSKNKADCSFGEKQIQYLMRLDSIRPLKPGEANQYWPGNEARWTYLVQCRDTKSLNQSFDLDEILRDGSIPYRTIMTFRKIEPSHEDVINNFLRKNGDL